MSSSQKSVLITGCSAESIGSSLALSFANRGFLVFATARNTSKIDPKLSSLSNVEVLTLDTTLQDSIDAAAQAVTKRTGGTLDYLVNNAGAGLVSPLLDVDLDRARKLFDVNFWGVLMCVHGFKELLIKSKGTIVNISSIAAAVPNPFEGIYNASKAALTHCDNVLRLELRPLDVNVVTVMAGMVQSAWYTNSMPQISLPEDSYYIPIADNINAGMTGESNKRDGMNVDEFGERVVQKVLAGKVSNGKIWEGGLSNMVYWLTAWFPGWVTDNMMYDRLGLKKLEGKIKST